LIIGSTVCSPPPLVAEPGFPGRDHAKAPYATYQTLSVPFEHRPIGWLSPECDGPEIADTAEFISLVRLGRVAAVLRRSLLTPAPPGIVCVPVPDAGPSRIAIARNAHDHLTALIAAAASRRHRERDNVNQPRFDAAPRIQWAGPPN
jgi:DNA-binding transcriptional LysR family regulator